MTNATTLISPDEILMYFTVFPLMVILGIFLLVFIAIMYVLWVPPEAKTYIKNKLKKKLMMDYESEAGVRKIETCTSYPEGIVVGDNSKNVYFLPRPISNAAVKKLLQQKDMTEDEIQKVVDNIRNMENRSLRPSIVSGIGCRIYRAFTSKAISTTLSALTGLEYSGEGKTVPVVISTPKSAELLKTINEKLKISNIIRVLLPVDPSVIQKWFPSQFTESQIRSRDRLSELIGAKDEKGYWKKVLAFCGILVTILIISFVAMMVLK